MTKNKKKPTKTKKCSNLECQAPIPKEEGAWVHTKLICQSCARRFKWNNQFVMRFKK